MTSLPPQCAIVEDAELFLGRMCLRTDDDAEQRPMGGASLVSATATKIRRKLVTKDDVSVSGLSVSLSCLFYAAMACSLLLLPSSSLSFLW
jgi:hypothetical protein